MQKLKKNVSHQKKSVEAYVCMCFMAACTCTCGNSIQTAAEISDKAKRNSPSLLTSAGKQNRDVYMGTAYMKGA